MKMLRNPPVSFEAAARLAKLLSFFISFYSAYPFCPPRLIPLFILNLCPDLNRGTDGAGFNALLRQHLLFKQQSLCQ